MRFLDLRAMAGDPRSVVPRAEIDVAAAEKTVTGVIDRVRAEREPAVLDYCEQFDGVRPAQLRVPAGVLARARMQLDPQVRASLEEAIRRVRLVHTDEIPSDRTTQVAPGGTVTQRWIPVDRVGLYVPGGRAVYPSSVVMNVVPAQLAGVGSIAIASPPQRDNDGWPHPTILAAAALLGIDEVYAVGGAQAVAWFAYGSAEDIAPGQPGFCEPVMMVTGPGNLWVTAAKRLLRGVIGIDSEAGPTEILVLADDSADPVFVAADLISQAEHDVIAASVLVTDSESLAAAVVDQLDDQVNATKHSERISQALRGHQSAVVLVRDLDQAVAVANAYGAEHLEIHTREATTVAGRIRNAGAVFVGPWSPVSLGDYCAGSNHVLPTGGCAGYSSGLSVHSFLRSVHVVQYDQAALQEVAADVTTLAHAEDLPAHAAAVAARLRVDRGSDS
ncbi:MAG: histidinol dehydrogenase [Candidatus Nanopelagicales bacterium]